MQAMAMNADDLHKPNGVSGRTTLVLLLCALLGAGLLFALWPVLHGALFASQPPLASGPLLVLLLLMGLTTVLLALGVSLLWPGSIGTKGQGNRMPVAQAVTEVRTVAPYLKVLSQQLDGTLKDTEQGVLPLITVLNQIPQVLQEQVQRIEASQSSGNELLEVVREKLLIDAQLGSILQMFVEKQEEDVKANLARIHNLQEIKELSSLVAVIASVAQQTNVLAINAAIEAARAGPMGRGFAVVAGEIRQLSIRTASAATEIGAKITTATQGVDEQLTHAIETSQRDTSTSNMRKVLADIKDMQARFAAVAKNNHMDEVIENVRQGHHALVELLTEAMGHVQFHDVMRQRIEHVQMAMSELDEHLQSMADQLQDRPWDPASMTSLKERLDAQVQRYVMQSQIDTHHATTGATTTSHASPAATAARPKIELF